MSTFVLVHSPLIGPLIWSGVAELLRKRQHRVVVPDLRGVDLSSPPFWQCHVGAVVASLADLPAASPLILVGHSGAGVLLPLIAAACARPIEAFLFVDADLPEDGKSRLDLVASLLSPQDADAFRRTARDGLVLPWSDEDLREAIPDATLRTRFIAELRPLPLLVYEEPLPEPDAWDEAPCGYLRLSDVYAASAAEARAAGWDYAELPGGHLMPLTDPGAVALTLILLCARMDVDLSRR